MLTYDEFKQAVDKGYLKGKYVLIIRKDNYIFDYVLPSEELRKEEKASLEKVVDVLNELQNI